MNKMVLVPGSSIPQLSAEISQLVGVPLVNPGIKRFANGEIFCEISESVRGVDVYVLQSTSAPANETLMELLIVMDALRRASANSITVVAPFFGYARQDRKVTPRAPITAKLVADLLTIAGATRVMTMDLHAGQIQGFFNIPFDNIYAAPIFFDYIREHLFSEQTVFISPDAGGVERTRYYAKRLNADLGMINKRRVAHNVAKAMNIVGDVEGRDCIIIDDMVDTAGTLVEGVQALKAAGAKKIYACITHPILSGPAVDRLKNCHDLDRLVVLDTIPLTEEARQLDKIHVLSIASLMSQAIKCTHQFQSISSLFDA